MAQRPADQGVGCSGNEGKQDYEALVVDDHPGMIAVVRQAIAELGWRHTAAICPAQALEALATRPPNLMVLDLHFPNSATSGFDLLETARRICAGVKVVVYSAFDDCVLVREAERSGAVAFVSKVQRLSVLKDVLKRAAAGDCCFPVLPSGGSKMLTRRQLDIVRHLASGLSEKETASRIGVTERTVVFHVDVAKRNCGARSIGQLVALAVERKWTLLS